MKGLDTNVLVRYLVQDDRAQGDRAARYIRESCTRDAPCYIAAIVLAELVWVLESAYGYEKPLIVEVLDRILAVSQFRIQDKDSVLAALGDFRTSRADYADCLLARVNRRAGCDHTVTFDRATRDLDGFRLL